MITTSAVYNIDFVTNAQGQNCKTAFRNQQNDALYLNFNGLTHSFRVQYRDVQRLFFFNTSFLQKTVFRNEYGIITGMVIPDKIFIGSVHIDEKRLQFEISGEAIKLSLINPQTKVTLLQCELNDELFSGDLDERNRHDLIHCIIFSFAWIL